MERRPWGVHTVSDIYNPQCGAGLPDGTYVYAVAEPYTAGRLKAAWWVLTGKAYAFLWPKHGDIEEALGLKPTTRRPWPVGNQARRPADLTKFPPQRGDFPFAM